MRSKVQSINSSQHDFSPLSEGKRVLEAEANALNLLSQSMGTEFEDAVNLLRQTTGRVIVTGMGKSGHIARKIAATFASTGTLSHFIHPAEASHGDMGMIEQGDLLLALSNSGETSELSDVIHYTRRYGIPLISITSNAQSTLATSADAALNLPKVEEACSLNLVPTTSTTMMIALGDALAVALLKLRGFTAGDFSTFHPGGKLGQRLLRIEKVMHKGDKVPVISQGSSMKEALILMTEKRFGVIGILSPDKSLLGIITDGDLRRHMSSDLLTRSVDDLMTLNPLTIEPTILASEALNIMNNNKITTLFAVDSKGSPVGIVHMHDLLQVGIA